MHIKSISHNLHSASTEPVTHDLTQRHIITGPNRSGKTAIIDAISLALAGYIPRLGKSGDKLEPVIGKSMKAVAVADLSEGLPRAFSIEKKPNGAVSKTASHKEPLTPFVIDSSIFLAAKPAERITMIQNAAGVDPSSLNTIHNSICKEIPLAKKHLSRSTDLGDYATESDANLAQAIKESKASLDRQHKALAAQIEHCDAIPVQYSEQEHQGLKKTIRLLEGVVAANESLYHLHAEPFTRPACPEGSPPQSDINTLRESLDKLTKEKSRLNAEYREAAVAKDALNHITIKENEPCPTCGAHKEHWAKSPNDSREIEVMREKASRLDAISDDLDAIEIEISAIVPELRIAQEWDAYTKAAATYESEEKRRTDELTQCQGLLAKSQAELNALRPKLEAMDKCRDLWVAHKTQEEQASRMKDEAGQMEAEIEMLKKARDLVKSNITHLSNSMMEPILEKARKFTDGIMPPLVSANFRIGYIEDGQWVPLEAFCGSEMAVATAALQAALQTQGDLKTIIIDEAQRIDPELLTIFARNIERAIATGVIEQAIIVGSRLQDAAKDFQIKSAWTTTIMS